MNKLTDLQYSHCTGCGNVIMDPDVCWCGAHIGHHTQWENHGFIPMGCDCGMDNPRLRKHVRYHWLDYVGWMGVWAASWVIYPFLPKSHAWKKHSSSMSLRSWVQYGTPLGYEFSRMFWLGFLMGLSALAGWSWVDLWK